MALLLNRKIVNPLSNGMVRGMHPHFFTFATGGVVGVVATRKWYPNRDKDIREREKLSFYLQGHNVPLVLTYELIMRYN